MGIPSYFFQIIKTHGDKFIGSKKKVGRLFLDLNCCIHGCKNRVLKEYNNTDIDPKFEERVIKEVIRTIIRFCKETSPTELLWIAVDGVVPVAKMKQQRERRVKAVHSREKIRTIHNKYGKEAIGEWDSNQITPGTPFMLKLCDSIKQNLSKIKKSTGVKRVLMNGVRNPGEGEQKIFEYMRNEPNNTEDYEDVVYGLDADLIILSILHTTHQKGTISLLREKQDFGKLVKNDDGDDVLLRFKVSEFSKIIPSYWGGVSGASNERLLYDYIILISLMGNDFVPHTPSLTFRSEGIERVIDAYRGVGKHIINDKFEIEWMVIRDIFTRLSYHERDVLEHDEEITEKIRHRILAGQVPFRHAIKDDPMEQEIASMDWEHIKDIPSLFPKKEGFAKRYYSGIKGKGCIWSSHNKMVKCIIKQYLMSIEWCWKYYNGHKVPMEWYYPYVSGPLLEDLKNINYDLEIHFKAGMKDIPSDVQLICVLPEKSHKKCMSSHILQKTKECLDLYPISYDLWSYGKRHGWEQEGFLPLIRANRIHNLITGE